MTKRNNTAAAYVPPPGSTYMRAALYLRRMRKSFVILLICLLPRFIDGADEKTEATARSPDGQWEYRYTEFIAGGIAKAGTTEIVLDLADNVPRPQEAKVLWAPDSKRFAYTCSPPHASHTIYEITTVYELRGDEWQPAKAITDEESNVPQVTQLAKDHLPKGSRARALWKSSPVSDVVRAGEWTDADTLVIRAHASWERKSAPKHAAFLFTLKFDADGQWKMVKTKDVTNMEEVDNE